jgi:hypothetical protein
MISCKTLVTTPVLMTSSTVPLTMLNPTAVELIQRHIHARKTTSTLPTEAKARKMKENITKKKWYHLSWVLTPQRLLPVSALAGSNHPNEVVKTRHLKRYID